MPNMACRHGHRQTGVHAGRDPRQHGARHQGQRHRWRPHPPAEDASLRPARSCRTTSLCRCTLLNLSRDSQAISVSNEYRDLGIEGRLALKKAAFRRKEGPGQGTTAAVTFRAAPDPVDPLLARRRPSIRHRHQGDTAPPRMVANMKVGNMDCFCVGEPWSQQLVQPEYRLQRADHRRTLVQASGEDPRHARRLEST